MDTKVSVIGEALAIYTTWGSGFVISFACILYILNFAVFRKRWVDFTERWYAFKRYYLTTRLIRPAVLFRMSLVIPRKDVARLYGPT